MQNSDKHRNAPVRRARSDGQRSRRAIVDTAARLATTTGLEGLSIGTLADHVGMSKSGLYAHFNSKEELQLAAIAAASEIFDSEVIRPAMSLPTPSDRLLALCENFLDHVRRGVFPGGCFFASAMAEFDTRSGTVRDVIAAFQSEWMRTLADLVAQSQAEGAISNHYDADQLAFELESALHLANAMYVLHRDPAVLDRAHQIIVERLVFQP
jgi:AcrR family transcriptional regulator